MFLAFFFFMSAAFAHDDGVCSDLLQNERVAKIVELVSKLNPELTPVGPVELAPLYVSLKREGERYQTKNLPPALAAYLVETYAGQFKITAPTAFYQNALYNLETRIAELWRAQETRAQTGSRLSGELETFAGTLFDTFFSPYGLDDRELRADVAEEFFAKKPWLMFPWREAINSVIRFKRERPGAFYAEYVKWYADRPGNLNWNQQQRIGLALSRAGFRRGTCCLSEPGCARCPLNRRSRISSKRP